MTIAAPIRKGLRARAIADRNPNLSPGEIARIVGTHPGNVAAALKKDHFGREKLKSRVT